MLSLSSLTLKRRIWIAVSLITLMPVIVFVYYLQGYYISSLTVLILVFIVFLGWWVVFEIILSICKIHSKGKRTLETMGQSSPPLANEAESLESIINLLSYKVKSSFEQLKDFSKRTEELNKEVSKKVFVLSTILEANDLFSKEKLAEEIIGFLMERLKNILEMKMCFCALQPSEADNIDVVNCLGIEVEKVKNTIDKRKDFFFKIGEIKLLDRDRKPPYMYELANELGIKNIGLNPITSRGKFMGVLGVGNNKDDFCFTSEFLDILNLFSLDIALICEHKRLSLKVDALEIYDYLTGLYNEKFMINRFEEEIRRATTYQRPCGFLLMEISNFDSYQKNFGLIEAEKLLKKIANIFKESLRQIDIIGRMGANKIGVILIERNKRECQRVADKLREELNYIFQDKVRFVFSVAENPIDGTTAQELIQCAHLRVNQSKANETS
jgi:diguanylate cyclase (GGDEF)-like protein